MWLAGSSQGRIFDASKFHELFNHPTSRNNIGSLGLTLRKPDYVTVTFFPALFNGEKNRLA